jgi:glucuronate isomerase
MSEFEVFDRADRLFPIEPAVRALARELYEHVAALPILSPHGHVPASLLRRDDAFADPLALFVSSDHYVTRLLHACGVDLAEVGVGGPHAAPREGWRTFASHWGAFAGTASGYWLEHTLLDLFGVRDLSAETADAAYDAVVVRLADPMFRPRALFERFAIEVLATTDDPLDDLSDHAALRADPAFRGRVLPTFRPDAYLDPESADFADRVQALVEHAGDGRMRFGSYLDALAQRREYFRAHGAVSADHGVESAFTTDLGPAPAAELFERALRGELDPRDARLFRAHMLLESARMSVRDGLVMTVHAGVRRNHSTRTLARLGPDTGHDIPLATTFTDEVRPLLEEVGLERGLHLVLFTVDETTFSRELAPLAGFYPSVFIGAPWWFLDAPDAGMRAREAVTETAGFSRNSGFIDDTRAFLSIPARHDMARRLDAAFLARLVAQGRVGRSAAFRIIHDQTDAQPRRVFKL